MVNDVTVLPIRNDEDFKQATDRLAEILKAPEGSPEADERDVLWTLAEAYDKQFAYPELTPREAVRLRMEERGLSASDLSIYFGEQSRVAEFLAGKRELTVEQIRRLHHGLDIPLAALVGSMDELWTVPGNRRQYVYQVVERKPTEAADSFDVTVKNSAGKVRRIGDVRPQSRGCSAALTAEHVYMPPDGSGNAYEVVFEHEVPRVLGYARKKG